MGYTEACLTRSLRSLSSLVPKFITSNVNDFHFKLLISSKRVLIQLPSSEFRQTSCLPNSQFKNKSIKTKANVHFHFPISKNRGNFVTPTSFCFI